MENINETIQNAQDGCGPGREPYWDELDTDGKIERMRQIVRILRHKVTHLSVLSSGLSRKFTQHKHVDGEVYLPLADGDNHPGVGSIVRKDEDKYF